MQGAQQKAGQGKEHRSIFHGFYNVTAQEGVRNGLYRGFSASAAREMSYGTLVLVGYEPLKEKLGLTESYSPLYLKILAGSMTGGLAALPTNPTDLLKVRMQADKGTP